LRYELVLAGGREFVGVDVLVDRIVGVRDDLLDGLMGEQALECVLGRKAGVDRLAEQLFGKGRIVQCAGEFSIDKSSRASDVVAAQVRAIDVGLDLYPSLHQRGCAADLQELVELARVRQRIGPPVPMSC
jgi:hypothetical protein